MIIFDVFSHLRDRIKSWSKDKASSERNASRRTGGKFSFAKSLNHNKPLRWLIVMITWFFVLLVIYCVGYRYIEGVSWMEAIWQGWQAFTTVGYGNQPPETFWGRWYTILLSTIGIAVVGAVFSAAFDYSNFLSELKRSGHMPNPHENGYVIFNFPNTNMLASFIRELRAVEANVGICVVDNRLEELPRSIELLENVHFLRGNTLSRTTYENANIKNNKAVIIFPRDPNLIDSDGTTKTIVDLIENFVGEETRVIHILVDPENAWMFKKNRSVSILESFELWAIIQECQDPYSANIFESLLMNTQSANPHTCTPKKIIGWTWEEFVIAAIKASKQINQPCTPLALIKEHKTLLCPSNTEIIDSKTLISVVAFNDFNWPIFEKNLHKSIV